MVNISLTLRFQCPDEHDASQVHQTMNQQGLALAGFEQAAQWNIDRTFVTTDIVIQGEFSPMPFMALYNLVSLWAIVLECTYHGTVILADGVEYDIEGDAAFIDNSWSHRQYSGVYANSGDNE